MIAILKRLLTAIPLLIGITFISFMLMQWAPGDPSSMLMDPQIKPEDMAMIKANLGLDKPYLHQYLIWLRELVQGNFGYSYSTGQPVLRIIIERLPATLILSISSLLFILCITFPLGLISGYKKESWFDHSVTLISFIGLSIPTFWLGLVFILYFSLDLGILPSSGFHNPLLSHASLWVRTLDIAQHLCLPLFTIVIGGIAGLTRYHRFGIIKILKADYILAARARGISEKRLLFKHAFKNAALPIITILGLQLPGLISGSFVIEYIFAWPGMGQLGVSAVFARDYPVLMGTLFFSAILIIVGNLLADLAYSAIDPRIRKPS
tara:strand:+ start:197 stop:1162 length:966 start_codon:yes stop_codon:yes gene_type:complete